MKKYLMMIGVLLSISIQLSAAKEDVPTPSKESIGNTTQSTESVVESIKHMLPIETPTNGTVIAIESPLTPLTVTTDLGYVEEDKMRYPETPELLKKAIMSNVHVFLQEPFVSVAEAAYNANIPFAIHFTSSTYPEGFTVFFSINDLREALSKTISDK